MMMISREELPQTIIFTWMVKVEQSLGCPDLLRLFEVPVEAVLADVDHMPLHVLLVHRHARAQFQRVDGVHATSLSLLVIRVDDTL